MRYPAAWLQGESLGEFIVSELRLQIINGAIPVGEVLSENRIASQFGSSRSPVRDAFKTLSNEGLLRLERMGAVVLGLSQRDMDELYDVRYLIESFVQERLSSDLPEQLIMKLQHIIDKMELSAKHKDYVEFAYQDLSFHETIIIEANHTRMLHLWKSIRQIIMTVLLLTTEEVFSHGHERIETVIEKHRRLIRGLQTRDSEVVADEVKLYFNDSRQTLHKTL
ncbi:GntR family transcriptional regulator [Paenibacillus sp. 453mf]|uniref:GntR family transcriptional regulator n=1 Tax=Paenibacillus sp. 453mf TaxID=1761874 RepID=UPI0008E485A8|nr:GntR family transcriptional regulator [Paenibacillus sp. 453mf]SFS75897.1 GntR family transcriptional regulator, gluconate operon transcriptional repressor [Paenibacillus sp. 453mf]